MRTLVIGRLALLAGAAVLVLGFVPAAAGDDCDLSLNARVTAAPGSTIQGSAELSADETHVTASMKIENLNPGEAYTIWFAYIDDPSKSGNYPGGTAGVCADADAITPADDPVGVFGRMDGAGAGSRSLGGSGASWAPALRASGLASK